MTRDTPRQAWLRDIPLSPAPVRQTVPSSRRSLVKRYHGNLDPDGEVFFPTPASVTCPQGYTTRSGDVRGATSHVFACTAACSIPYTSEGCGLADLLQTHDSVSHGQSYSGLVVLGAVGRRFRAATPIRAYQAVEVRRITTCTTPLQRSSSWITTS